MTTSTPQRVCVIGAGAAGLETVRVFRDAGHDVVAFDRSERAGGHWHTDYEALHLITPRDVSCFDGVPMPASYPLFPSREQVIAYLDAFGLESAHVVGFSDGAILGMMLALEHPTRVRSLVSISGNVDTDAFVSDEEAAHTMTAEASAQLDREYADLSPDGPDHGEAVVAKLTQMWLTEPQITPEMLATITAPTLIMAGDHDMVRADHTLTIVQAVPGAQLAIVPGAGHLVPYDRPALVELIVREFLSARH